MIIIRSGYQIMLISSRCQVTRLTIARSRLTLLHPSSFPIQNRNTAYTRYWFSTKEKVAKKDDSIVTATSAENEKKLSLLTPLSVAVSSKLDKFVKSNMPLVLQKIICPNNAIMTKPVFLNSSIAMMFGHTAFLMTGMAYLTKDILQLRLLAMSGISMSMIFQYYRPEPLKMPLRWNGLFLVINCVMASLLWNDRYEAEGMSTEMLEIYRQGMFKERGFRKVDFYRLFGLAKKEVRKKGEYLKQAGEKNHQLCYIVSGKATIARNQSYLGDVTNHDFVGEIEFMRLMTADEDIQSGDNIDNGNNVTDITNLSNQLYDDALNTSSIANESVVVKSDMITMYTWEFDELKSYLDTHVLVSNALLAFISHELREKLAQSWNMKVEGDKEHVKMKQLAVNYLMEGIKN